MSDNDTPPALLYLLDLGDGGPPSHCRDAYQALRLAEVYILLTTGKPHVRKSKPDERPPA